MGKLRVAEEAVSYRRELLLNDDVIAYPCSLKLSSCAQMKSWSRSSSLEEGSGASGSKFKKAHTQGQSSRCMMSP